MRPSSIWFIVSAFWLADVFIGIARGHARQSWLTAVIALAFFILGLIHRSREEKSIYRRRLR